jgi:hypothetical protein
VTRWPERSVAFRLSSLLRLLTLADRVKFDAVGRLARAALCSFPLPYRTSCRSLEAMQHGTIRAMELGYARQVLDLAVESFVADTGSLQDRLCAAYVSHLIKLREENFTPALWLRFERLKKAVTMYAAKGDEGVVKASTSKMTDNEASQWIKEILSLFSVVAGLDVMSRTRIR